MVANVLCAFDTSMHFLFVVVARVLPVGFQYIVSICDLLIQVCIF